MRRIVRRVIPILAGLIAGIVISCAFFWVTGFPGFFGKRGEPPIYDEVSNASLTALAFSILDDIKVRDYQALSGVVHPEYGVVFSPCSAVNLMTNKCFSPAQVAAFGTDANVYVWGVYSSGGEPIEMTPADYFSYFVFPEDYSTASVVGVNHIVRSGNALENITEMFPDAEFVDFHIPSGDRYSAEDSDWSSLRLGFEDYGGALMLTLILHSDLAG